MTPPGNFWVEVDVSKVTRLICLVLLMSSHLPFSIPSKLPRKITRCPILEAVMEIRFVPRRPWDHFPGLFADKFSAKYPKEEDTGIAQLPQVIRDQDPRLRDLPYKRYVGEKFVLQVGPRVVGLVTKRNAYPGWDAFWPAMKDIIDNLRGMGVMNETVRLGLRYINFFGFDIFEQLSLTVSVGGAALRLPETGFNTVFLQDNLRHFVQINNASLIADGEKVMKGSILDIDTTTTNHIGNISAEAEALFSQAHSAEKSVFFGLLKPEFVATLSPEY